MSSTWHSEDQPLAIKIGPVGWALAAVRAGLILIVTMTGLALMLLLRLIEKPIWGAHRPWTPFITQVVCKIVLLIFGLRHKTTGRLMRRNGAIVANHSTWLDIFTLNATAHVYFVAKSEVANWVFIGWLARATGTIFIRREAKDAQKQKQIFQDRLKDGHKLLFFPEGTSTDGQRVIPFKPTLFAAFFEPEFRPHFCMQPVTVRYTAPKDQDPRYYGWWGDMDFGRNFLQILATVPQGRVEVIYHEPLDVADFTNRKELAAACQKAVEYGMQTRNSTWARS